MLHVTIFTVVGKKRPDFCILVSSDVGFASGDNYDRGNSYKGDKNGDGDDYIYDY
jgi:hypothetical protein